MVSSLKAAETTTLTSFAGTLQRSGASPEALSAALAAENHAKCSPPLDPAEIETIIGSVTKCEKNKSKCGLRVVRHWLQRASSSSVNWTPSPC